MNDTTVINSFTKQDFEPLPPLLFVVWIDTNCGYDEPDWEMDCSPGNPNHLEPLPQALAHAADVRSRGVPAILMLPGQTPRADGLFSNPATDP